MIGVPVDFDESDSVSDQPYINEAPEKPELPTESIGHDNEKIGQDNRLIDRATGALGNDYSRLKERARGDGSARMGPGPGAREGGSSSR